MSTRVNPRGPCPCARPSCARARRADNIRAALYSLLIVGFIFIFAGIYLMIGATP